MKYLEFLIFVIYNGNYRDGTNPHFDAKLPILALVILQFMFLVMLLPFIDSLFGVMFLNTIKSVGALIIALVLFFLNYWYFIRKQKFDILYTKYSNSAINNKINRIFSVIMLFSLFIIMIFVIGYTKQFLNHISLG